MLPCCHSEVVDEAHRMVDHSTMTCTFYYFREITYYVLVVAKLKISKRQVANLGLLLKARHKPLGLLLGLQTEIIQCPLRESGLGCSKLLIKLCFVRVARYLFRHWRMIIVQWWI